MAQNSTSTAGQTPKPPSRVRKRPLAIDQARHQHPRPPQPSLPFRLRKHPSKCPPHLKPRLLFPSLPFLRLPPLPRRPLRLRLPHHHRFRRYKPRGPRFPWRPRNRSSTPYLARRSAFLWRAQTPTPFWVINPHIAPGSWTSVSAASRSISPVKKAFRTRFSPFFTCQSFHPFA